MGASEGGGTRLAAAQSTLRDELEALPGDERVALILAGAESRLLYEGSAGDAAGAVAKIRPTFGPADLGAALRLAAGLPRDGGAVELLRAPETQAPRTVGDEGAFRERVVGSPIADLGIAEPSARCLGGAAGRCELFARIESTASAPRDVQVEVLAGGKRLSAQTVARSGGRVGAGRLQRARRRAPRTRAPGGDPLAADDRAYVDVPATEPLRVTLVGERQDAEPLARALLAVPGAKVTLRTPADFRARRRGTRRTAGGRRGDAEARRPRRRPRDRPRRSAAPARRQGRRAARAQSAQRHRRGRRRPRRGGPRLADDRPRRRPPPHPAAVAARGRLGAGRAAARPGHPPGPARSRPRLRPGGLEPAAARLLPAPGGKPRRLEPRMGAERGDAPERRSSPGGRAGRGRRWSPTRAARPKARPAPR